MFTASSLSRKVIDAAAENSIVVIPGANNAIPVASVEAFGTHLKAGDIVLLQQEVPGAINRLASRIAQAAGATVIWNAAPAPTSRADLITDIDLQIVNEHELAAIGALLGIERHGGNIEVFLGHVADNLEVDVVCTLGADGAVYRVAEETGRAAAPLVRAVDTTAAGDTFVGYLAATSELPFANRMQYALNAGSLTVTRPGASDSIPTHAEVKFALDPSTPEMSRP